MTCDEARERMELGERPEHAKTCEACRAYEVRLHSLSTELDAAFAWTLKRPRRVLRALGFGTVAAAVLVAVLLLWPRVPVSEAPIALQSWRVAKLAPSELEVVGPNALSFRSGELLAEGRDIKIQSQSCLLESREGKFFVTGGTMKGNHFVGVIVVAGLVQLSNGLGGVTGSPGEALWAQDSSAPEKHVEKLALRFAKYYQAVAVIVKPSVPAYELPVDLTKVGNYDDVRQLLSPDEKLLSKNGFVVVPPPKWLEKKDDMVEAYKAIKDRRVPMFITVDSLLHLYHIQFDETLKDIEEREFYRDICAIGETMFADLKDPKARTYFAIGLKALKPEWALPDDIKADAELVLEKIKTHEGHWPEPDVAHQAWPLFRYAENFSQYNPRGHYTRSETLKKYFVGLMWFGRMTFLLKGGKPFGPGDVPYLVSAEEAKLQTSAAAEIVKLMGELKLSDGRSVRETWERLYAVTAFYVGLADDLGFQEYREALTKVLGNAWDLKKLADDKTFAELQKELAKFGAPAIYSGTGGQSSMSPGDDPGKLLEILDKTTGFRFMGQRFVPDSYIMGKLVYPTIGIPIHATPESFTYVMSDGGPIRGFPRGLDVMALFGSERAKELLTEYKDDGYKGYAETRAALEKEFSAFSEKDWNRNMYWSWLYCLKPLLGEFGKGYPTFMTTPAYRDKNLNAALGSWAQLRHDTILYAKQSETSAPGEAQQPPTGYVEPIPDFYARLLALTRMTSRGLREMKVLNKNAISRLNNLEDLLKNLFEISVKELQNETLSESESLFLATIGETMERCVLGVSERGTTTAIIADVHTDANTRQALEEGTGHVRLGVFVCPTADGKLFAATGPVFSYHEFKHPMSDRLTDEAWQKMLKDAKAPAPVPWSASYSQK